MSSVSSARDLDPAERAVLGTSVSSSPGAGGLAPIVASTPSQQSATPRCAGTPATSAWKAPSRIRAVCSARVRSRPSQNSSWAIRASIRRARAVELLLLLGLA